MTKYGSWRHEIQGEDDTMRAARLGLFVLMWLGIFWAGAAWLVLWVIRSSGYTEFSVTWWKLAVASIVLTFVRNMEYRLRR